MSRFWRSLLAPPGLIPALLVLFGLIAAVLPPRSVALYLSVSLEVMFVGVLLATVIHETGHLLAGQRVGFRFARLVVGPLEVYRDQGGSLKRRTNMRWRLIGLAVSVPPDATNLRQRQIVFMAGGSVMNLAAGLLAFFLQDRLGGPVQTWIFEGGQRGLGELTVVHFLYFFGGTSCLLGLINLIPGEVAGLWTDGAWMRVLLRRGPSSARASASLALSAVLLAGQTDHPLLDSWQEQAHPQMLEPIGEERELENGYQL
jgi:hypothetical protein